jgi:hypothetical protein
MPEMAFDPDISGVCRLGGTLVIISKPTKIASTNTVSEVIKILICYLAI